MATLPYQEATTGRAALDEIRKVVIGFGCSNFSVDEDFAAATVTIRFTHKDKTVEVTASAKGYANRLTSIRPWSTRMQKSRETYWEACLKQGHIAVWSILRDWIKGQMTAIDCGVISFEGAFFGQILLEDGRTRLQQIREDEKPKLLPSPTKGAA